MEGLAAVAAATQLADYALRMAIAISKVRDRIRSAPERFVQYSRQVDRLVLITQEIEQNPDLQTPVVSSYLSATLAEAEAAQNILDRFLKDSRKRRYWGVASGRSQRGIMEHLDNVQHSVAELSLCITSINTRQLVVNRRELGEVRVRVDSLVREWVVPHQGRISAARPRNNKRRRRHRARSNVQEAMMPNSNINHLAGGSTYGKITLKGNHLITVGNTTHGEDNPTGAPSTTTPSAPSAPSHQYGDIDASENKGLFIGNVGLSGGHKFGKLNLDYNSMTKIGNFSSLAAKKEDIRLEQELMKSMPNDKGDIETTSAGSNCSEAL